MMDLNKLEFRELEILLKTVEFYQKEQSFPKDDAHWEEVESLRQKLIVAFID